MKNKKKFFDTTLGKVMKGAASIVAPQLVSVLEGTTSVAEALNIIKSSDVPDEVKLQLEQIALDYEKELTKRHESDNRQGLWLPRLVRPLTLSILTMAYIIGFFLEYEVSIMHAPLMTVFGFYFGSRGLEKLFQKQI